MSGNKKERNEMVASAIRHKSVTFLLVATMMIAGMVSLRWIPKDEFPQVTVPVGLVVGIYPGASELEVEQQLAKPLENFLWTFKEVDKDKTVIMSFSNASAALVYLKGAASHEKKTEFWNKLKERLSLLKLTLPTGVLKLVADDDFSEASTMLLTIESDEKTYRELEDFANTLSARLRTVKGLANINTLGNQKEQIGIYLDRDRLSMYDINTTMLISKLSGQTGTFYTGSVSDGRLSRSLHVQSSLNTENDVAQTILNTAPSGEVLRLCDVATIKREQPDPTRYIKNNGKKCLLLSVQMENGINILDFGDDVKQVISDFQATLPANVEVNLISDQSQVVGDSVHTFLGELVIAIISVIIIVMLMLPMRVAVVAVSTIPITIFASIFLLHLFGLEINTVTLAALIVSLGMIVDDSVVVVDCYLDKLDEGMNRWRAAIESSNEFLKSIITATIVITFTFFPQLITTTQIMRDFMKWFPYSVTIVLVVSLVVAIFVVPLMQYLMIGKGLRQMGREHSTLRFRMLEKVQTGYERFVEMCFRHKWATMMTGVVLIVLGGVLLLSVPQRLTPRAERNQFAVEIFLPTGTDLRYTAQVADSLAAIMMKDERVENLTIFYGSGSPRFHAMFMPNLGGSHFAQFIVNTHNDAETQGMLDDYADKYSTYFSDAQILFRQIEYSDVSYPVEVRVTGDNLDSLHVATDSIWNRLARNKNINVLNTSWGAINNRLEVIMHPEEANRLGISKTMLSLNFALRYGGGIPVASIWEGDHELSLVIRDVNESQETVDNLKNIRVSGLIPTLTATPLTQIADVMPGWGDGCICRRNGVRTASVYGMMTRGALVGPLTKEIYEDLETLRLPQGVTVVKGGVADMDHKYRPQIYLGVLISVLMIFFVIVFHLKSIMLTLLVMFSLFFSFLGGGLGMALSGDEFGATGVLGFITLMGIITRCSIIMIDYAEEIYKTGHVSPDEAALLSAKRRFRPVFLTSAAASMGVITMVIKNSALWHPMGMVIFVGALVSMLLILTLIPVGYCLIRNKFKDERDEACQL